MQKIVVTTDLSDNSRSAVRFAMEMAAGRDAELVMLHVYHVLRASMWSEADYRHFSQQFRQTYESDLASFVKEIAETVDKRPKTYRLALHQCSDTVEGIIEFAEAERADYICSSTHGAGLVRKVMGTVTGKLISRSPIPVLSIPSDYTGGTIERVVYATDMCNVSEELSKVIRFVRPFKAEVDVVHFAYDYEFIPELDHLEETLRHRTGYPVRVSYRLREPGTTMQENLEAVAGELRPSLLAMFTHQDKDFLENILLPAHAKEFAFHAMFPLLSFRKDTGAIREEFPARKASVTYSGL